MPRRGAFMIYVLAVAAVVLGFLVMVALGAYVLIADLNTEEAGAAPWLRPRRRAAARKARAGRVVMRPVPASKYL